MKAEEKYYKESASLKSKQVGYFLNLKRLLEIKIKSLAMSQQKGGDVGRGTEEYNRLVIG